MTYQAHCTLLEEMLEQIASEGPGCAAGVAAGADQQCDASRARGSLGRGGLRAVGAAPRTCQR